ncbi:hypothetical protein LSAT2_031513, partial [Lamellibrachia satsuma]
EVIRAITSKEGYFRKVLLKFRKPNLADKLKVVGKIVGTLLHHPSSNVSEVANCSLRRDKKGVFTQPTLDGIADTCRQKIEMQGNPLGLMLMAEPVKTGVLSNGKCILLKGKFNNK